MKHLIDLSIHNDCWNNHVLFWLVLCIVRNQTGPRISVSGAIVAYILRDNVVVYLPYEEVRPWLTKKIARNGLWSVENMNWGPRNILRNL